MRPATSGRSVTDSSERRLPTAVIDLRHAAPSRPSTASTVTSPRRRRRASPLALRRAARRRRRAGGTRDVCVAEPVAAARGDGDGERDDRATMRLCSCASEGAPLRARSAQRRAIMRVPGGPPANMPPGGASARMSGRLQLAKRSPSVTSGYELARFCPRLSERPRPPHDASLPHFRRLAVLGARASRSPRPPRAQAVPDQAGQAGRPVPAGRVARHRRPRCIAQKLTRIVGPAGRCREQAGRRRQHRRRLRSRSRRPTATRS